MNDWRTHLAGQPNRGSKVMMGNIILDQVLGSSLLRKLQAMQGQPSHVHYHQQAAANNHTDPNFSSLSDIHMHDDALLEKQESYHTMNHDMLPPSSPPPPPPQDAVINYLLANSTFPYITCKEEEKEEEEDEAAAQELVLVSSLPSCAALLGPRQSFLRTSDNHDFENSYSSHRSHNSYNTPLVHYISQGSGRYISDPSSSYNTPLTEHVQYPSPTSGRYSTEPSRSYTHLASEDLSLLKESMQDKANCLGIDHVLESNLTELKRDASCSLSCMMNANNPHLGALSTSSSSTPTSLTSGLTIAKENLQAWMAFDEHYNSCDPTRDFHVNDKQSTFIDMNNMVDGDQKNVCNSMTSHEKKKKRKRKRTSHKNVEEMECQRMTHIAVERNRRKQMNEHLRALRLLMPHSYIQRGDQASIVGGTIRFVEELEQVLQSLRLQKQLRSHGAKCEANFGPHVEESYASTRSCMANVEVTMLTTSTIFMKVLTPKRPHQLLHTLLAFTKLSLKVMHLNVTTIELNVVLYSFNLQMGDDCQLHTPTELAETIQHIFSM